MNILFFAVFLLFSLLILRLGVVQIVSGEEYKREVERTEDVLVNNSVPRGKIYDRVGNVIVDNTPMNAITYTRTQSTKTDEIMDVARKLAQLIEMDTDAVRDRDKKDYWILNNKDEADEKVSKKEKAKISSNEDLSEDEINSKIYQLTLDRITEKDLESLTNQDMEDLAIFREMNSGYALSPQMVKNKGVSQEEFARVSEHLSELPGVNTTTDWERTYVFDKTLRSILGNVSSSREGLPSEMVDYYLARDYNRNDRVGKTYLELQYEDVLKGQKEKIKNITKDGSVLESVLIQEGQRGKDVVLTIDMELQQEVEKIVTEELLKNVHKSESRYLDRAFVVMMDPNTGEVLAMVGKKYAKDPNTGEYRIEDYALGTYTSFYEVGSVVKGATVLTGYMTGVLNQGEVIRDEPIKIKDTPIKKSWYGGSRTLTDQQALEVSSNGYMWKVAMRIAGNPYYVRDAPISGSAKDLDTMRNHFAQFGLGVKTGIDLPGEVDGYKGTFDQPGNMMDFAIGQFDTYTPLQLAQYVSTIANDGYRVQPHILKEIRKPSGEKESMGPVETVKQPQIMNKVDVTQNQIEHVQGGFYRVYHNYPSGTASKEFHDAPYVAAGKSGTAEARYRDPVSGNYYDTYNTTLIGYAPYSQPEVAFSTVVPWSHVKDDPYINKIISRKIMDAYYDLKKKREKEGMNSSEVESKVENVDDASQLQEETREENAEENGGDSSTEE
ncbi:penicillin-binding protein 2 [Bacillus salacetis]|uniref:serine-type D-Ala-D-Ala carboxypeptidase n=1 Tax=Bacillus salacetis TaxID=2315464 RepID=A0A3A1QTU4_9BACI|nr:penicillin-binding protein 2 [Bacillus salacetis]RIW31095.1 penicillin-binding protein 2 [Bacillus salacetis]